MSDCSARYIEASTWHWLSDRAANVAYALLIAVIIMTPVIGVVGGVGGGVWVGVEAAYVFAGGVTVLAGYFLAVSFVLAEFQTNGLPVVT